MSCVYLDKTFLGSTAERAVKTFAQSALALIVGSYTGLLDVDWLNLASVAGLAALVSVLTSVGSASSPGTKAVAEATSAPAVVIEQADSVAVTPQAPAATGARFEPTWTDSDYEKESAS